jgi:mRNA-degrading endonuclease toxin of MazEF toxin-antitoxin module
MRKRLGFGEAGHGEPVVVMQATELNAALPTTIVVPLDLALDVYAGLPSVPVSALEAGATADHLALPTQLRVIATDRLAPGAVGRLRSDTLMHLEEMIRVVLDL